MTDVLNLFIQMRGGHIDGHTESAALRAICKPYIRNTWIMQHVCKAPAAEALFLSTREAFKAQGCRFSARHRGCSAGVRHCLCAVRFICSRLSKTWSRDLMARCSVFKQQKLTLLHVTCAHVFIVPMQWRTVLITDCQLQKASCGGIYQILFGSRSRHRVYSTRVNRSEVYLNFENLKNTFINNILDVRDL